MDASQKLQRRSSGDGHLIRSLLAGSAGNFLEFFDFALFGMFANEISATFFPPDDSATETKLLTFLVFGTGFTMRPIGGLFFGYIGDTVGRVYAMRLSLLMMGLPTLVMALLPGYATLGLLSPSLLLLTRVFQGLSVGGQFGGLMTYAMEVAPPNRLGVVSAGLKVTSGAGTMVGSAVAAAMHALFTPEQLLQWAWRLPFFAAVGPVLVTGWMRHGMHDGEQFAQAKASGSLPANPIRSALRMDALTIGYLLLVINLNNVGYYTLFVWLPAFVSDDRYWCDRAGCDWTGIDGGYGGHEGKQGCFIAASNVSMEVAGPVDRIECPSQVLPDAYTINTAVMVVCFIFEMLGGWWSDHLKEGPVWPVGAAASAFGVLAPLVFRFLFDTHPSSLSPGTYLANACLLSALLGLYIGPMTWWMAIQLPNVGTRNTSLGLAYNIATTIGGFTPTICTLIASAEGQIAWIGVINSAFAVSTAVGLVLSRSRHPRIAAAVKANSNMMTMYVGLDSDP